MNNTVKIGDTVMWRGDFGRGKPEPVKVVGMELTETPRAKYGVSVDEALWSSVKTNRVIFTLDNNKWAYGEQISPN